MIKINTLKSANLKLLPFFSSILFGITILFASFLSSNSTLTNVLVNISSSFLSIPLIFLFYDWVKLYSTKKLQASVNYSTLDEINILIKYSVCNYIDLVYGSQKILVDSERIQNLNLSLIEITKRVSRAQYLGFIRQRSLGHYLYVLNKILNNNFTIKYLDDDTVEYIVELKILLTKIHNFQENSYNFTVDDGGIFKHKEFTVKPINPLSDIYVLLKEDNDKTVHTLIGFSKITDYQYTSLPQGFLVEYRIKDDRIIKYAEILKELADKLVYWTNRNNIVDLNNLDHTFGEKVTAIEHLGI